MRENFTQEYLNDWRKNENANSIISIGAMRSYVADKDMALYTLEKLPEDIQELHNKGYVHLHDLGMGITLYCMGHSLQDLILKGLWNGKIGTIRSKPAKHFDALLGQIMNFFFLLQTESAGAQSFSNFDTFLSPYVYYDKLSYNEVKQALQNFIYSLNQPLRSASQMPFTNLTLDGYNKDLDDTIVVYAGKYLKDKTYKDFKKERLMIFKAFTEILTEGDGMGQTFTFPIPTINISKDFDFNSELFDLVLENTKKYGNFYFANYVNSVLDPTDARSLCCRLRLSIKDLHKHHHSTGGLFGSSEKTGSVAVSTINLPLLAYESKSEAEFFQKLDNIMEKMGEYHKIKREIVEDTIEKGLTPYIAYYYGDVKKRYGSFTANHFSTIGMLGMEETIKNLFGKEYNMFTHKEFAQKVLDFMLDKELKLQEKYGFLFNLEETPAEGASYRLAMKAKELHPDIITADEETPYFTNGVLPHVSSTSNPFKLADNQDQLVSKFTSGSVVHFFLDETPSINSLRAFIKTIIERTDIPYFTITPTFGICPIHGYIPGNFDYCPYCEAESDKDNEDGPEFITGV